MAIAIHTARPFVRRPLTESLLDSADRERPASRHCQPDR
jgi:hypothetical protein